MTKNERVRELRAELKLSQAAFGKEIKISQRAVGLIESGVNNLSPRTFELICYNFNVNPQWLESGEPPMFAPSPEKDFLDRLAEEKGLNPMEKALIGSIIDLPRPAREAVIDWAFKLVISIEAQATDEQRENQIRELERSIAEQQAKLEKLKEETGSYAEDTSIGAG